MIGSKQVGPFMGVHFDQVCEKEGRKFRILTYQAYNARGLIGPELNGVAVLDEDEKRVVSAEIECLDSGYFGIDPRQTQVAEELVALPWAEFRARINAHQRTRVAL